MHYAKVCVSRLILIGSRKQSSTKNCIVCRRLNLLHQFSSAAKKNRPIITRETVVRRVPTCSVVCFECKVVAFFSVSVFLVFDWKRKMGQLRNARHPYPSRRKLSLKKGYRKRRMLKRLTKMQADLEAQNKSTDPSTSVELLRDVINSEINNKMTHFHQIKEEQMDSNGEKIETYNEKAVLNETIEYCTHQDFIFVNANNVVKTEDYKEEDYEEKDSMLSQNIEYPVDTKDTTIDNNCFVDTHSTRKNIPTGRFIVDFSFIWSEIQRIFNDHARGLNCQFKYWKLVNSHRRGFLTQFFFKCEMCHYEASIWSEPVGTKTPDINADAVTASVATGIPSSRLRKLLASLNIIYMPEKINRKH